MPPPCQAVICTQVGLSSTSVAGETVTVAVTSRFSGVPTSVSVDVGGGVLGDGCVQSVGDGQTA